MWPAGQPVRLPAWMTETGPLPIMDRPRIPAGSPEGGRFARYAELPTPPAPRPVIRQLPEFAGQVALGVVAVCCAECVYGVQA